VGTSPESWEKAAAAAVRRAAKTLRDLRVAEIAQLDMQLKDGKVESYRARSRFPSSTKATKGGMYGLHRHPYDEVQCIGDAPSSRLMYISARGYPGELDLGGVKSVASGS